MTRLTAFFPANASPSGGPDVVRRVFVRRKDAQTVASMIDPSVDFDLDFTDTDVASVGFLCELLKLRPRVRSAGALNEDVAEAWAIASGQEDRDA
jgi:hypothetical protein